MASQGEREPGGLVMCCCNLDSMVQDGDPEQEMLVVQDELSQTNPEPEMGAAAAAAFDTSPPLLRNPPPIPAETAQPRALDMILQAINGMKNKMDGNTQQMNGINENACRMEKKMEKMQGEMQKMGHGLQAGIMAISCSETWSARKKMATPRAATNELGGSATAVRPAVAAGEDRVIRETCWARSVKVTETVTQGEKLTELTETREMGTIGKRLHGTDGVKDAHTHTQVVEDNGGELAECVETRCGQRGSLLRERRETLCSLEADLDQVSRSCRTSLRGRVRRTGARGAWGVWRPREP